MEDAWRMNDEEEWIHDFDILRLPTGLSVKSCPWRRPFILEEGGFSETFLTTGPLSCAPPEKELSHRRRNRYRMDEEGRMDGWMMKAVLCGGGG